MSDDGGYQEWKLEQELRAMTKIAEKQLEKIAEEHRDAERYRWLKKRLKREWGVWYVYGMRNEGPTEVDAAIDYAMKTVAE